MYESYLEYVREHWEENITVDRIDTNWNYNKEIITISEKY